MSAHYHKVILRLAFCVSVIFTLLELSTAEVTLATTGFREFHECVHDTLLHTRLEELPLSSIELHSPLNAKAESDFFAGFGLSKVYKNSSLATREVDRREESYRSLDIAVSASSSNNKDTTLSNSANDVLKNSNDGINLSPKSADSITGRNLKFHVISLLNSSCSTEGQSVPNYISAGVNVSCGVQDVLTSSKKQFVINAVEEATKRLSAALIAIPTRTISVPSNACIGFSANNFIVEDADFVLFVTAAPLTEAGQTIAWGRPCVREGLSAAGRPIIGHINFVPPRISAEGLLYDQSIVITMHEISHALGFINLYSTLSSFVDLDGERHSNGGTARVYRPGLQKEVQLVQTPRVLAAARNHFGCSTLDGVEIEDMGGSGTAGSHWKKRIFYEEALVGVISSASLFYSSVTFAFFEDAGFYKVDYYYAADGFRWGYHRGCPFVMQNCRYLYDNGLADEFCFQEKSSSKKMCSYERDSVGYCDVMIHSSALPENYQYYPADPRQGGSLSTMDYCPAVLYYENFNCVNPYSVPLLNIYGNEFGRGNRCFNSNIISHTVPLLKPSPHCFRVSCLPGVAGNGSKQVVLQVQGQTLPCPSNGMAGRADTSGLRGLHGFVDCPSETEICPFLNTSGFFSTENPNVPEQGISQNFTNVLRLATVVGSDINTLCTSRLEACKKRLSLKKYIRTKQLFSCSSVVEQLKRCGGIECLSSMKEWVQSQFGLVPNNCWKGIKSVVKRCSDGWEGANAVCTFLALE